LIKQRGSLTVGRGIWEEEEEDGRLGIRGAREVSSHKLLWLS
jgi:hypothetical protein